MSSGSGLPSLDSLPIPNLADITALQAEMLTVSGLTGYTAGFAVKRTFKVFLFTAGTIFIGLQALAHNKLITVHYDEMEKRLRTFADIDQDGKINPKDLQRGSDQLQAYLAAGLPSAGTFGVGFLLGLRS